MYYIARNDPGTELSEILNMIEMISIMVFCIILVSGPTRIGNAFSTVTLAMILQMAVNAFGIVYTSISISIGYGKMDNIDTIHMIYGIIGTIEIVATINFTIMSISAFTDVERGPKKNSGGLLSINDTKNNTSQLRITASVILLIINISVDTCLVIFGYLHSMSLMTNTLYYVFMIISAILHVALYATELCSMLYICLLVHKNDQSSPRKTIVRGIIVQIAYGLFVLSHLLDLFTHLEKNVKVACMILRILSTAVVVKLL